MGIIILLVALLLPALMAIEDHANKAKCLSNLRQIAVAANNQYGDLGEQLPYRGTETDNAWAYWGRAAEELLPYLKNIKEVFHCPGNPGTDHNSFTVLPSYPGYYTDYELNGFLCTFGNVHDNPKEFNRRQNRITDQSKVAFAYDYPYSTISGTGYDPQRDRAHKGGINCAYLDGHAAWLPDDQLGTLTVPADETTFYCKGHDFWQPSP